MRSGVWGAIAGLGVLFSSVWFLAVLGISLLLYDIWYRTISVHESYIKALVFGSLYGALSLWWLWDVLPMPGIDASISIQGIVIGLLWLVCALLCGVSFALIAPLLYCTRTHALGAISAAVLICVAEYMRMWFFSILALGPGSLVGAHFSQTSVGYVLAESPLLALATQGGIWALSGAVVLLAAAFTLSVRAVQERHTTLAARLAVGCLLITFCLSMYLASSTHTQLPNPLKVAVVHGTSKGPEGADILKTLAVREQDIDLIVMPEGDRFYTPDTALTGIFAKRVLIISSHHPKTERGYVSELTYQWSDTGVTAIYQKQFLMPQGEYTPYIASVLFDFIKTLGGPTLENPYTPKLVPGDHMSSVSVSGMNVAGLICSDLLSPFLYPTIAKEHGAQILVNSANHTWLNDSVLYNSKVRQIAAVHATYTGTYMLLASVGMPALIISPTGTVLDESDGRGYVSRVLGD